MIPLPAVFDVSLLLLRVLIGVLFATSGWRHATDPEARGESIGLSPAATRALGIAELAAGLALILGVFDPFAALIVIGIMVGAIYKKMFVWNSGFWGDDGGGWFYDLLYLVCALVIAASGGGSIGLT